ncbi:hypothetical protein CLG96_03005 [Sphingomonas oleivorans]|uniref:Uncharacterized protein n=1 Tax=Sphingomonas oleivorans TaxID=1735121 RepID=A0A2T5G1U0_9SPHN|nr:hypothetical protein [Sphingomonas oleivorans]PTQ13114.1 hypothetical protein CLG96_03005 [Sphingomonas oleivorans]
MNDILYAIRLSSTEHRAEMDQKKLTLTPVDGSDEALAAFQKVVDLVRRANGDGYKIVTARASDNGDADMIGMLLLKIA